MVLRLKTTHRSDMSWSFPLGMSNNDGIPGLHVTVRDRFQGLHGILPLRGRSAKVP
jgi:hypothetical protein